MTKFLLDSGDPDEYKKVQKLAREKGSEIWGATTNPSLIAKKLAGKKITQKEAFELQKQIVMEIIDIVPGAVSAEVYANEKTTSSEMIKQGRVISKWHKRVVVKLPTTIEGFKARTTLREEHIPINNTLVFSQEQVFAICLHELIMQKEAGPTIGLFPPFISPFVGRLDDINIDGMMLIEHSMKIINEFELKLPKTKLAIWMLEASVRSADHIKRGLNVNVELITAPAKVFVEWFKLSPDQKENLNTTQKYQPIDYFNPPVELFSIEYLDDFTKALETKKLDISHLLTDRGLVRFAEDWKSILI